MRECLGADTAHACMCVCVRARAPCVCACACHQAERAKWVVDKALEEKKSIVISAKGEAEAATLIGIPSYLSFFHEQGIPFKSADFMIHRFSLALTTLMPVLRRFLVLTRS